MTAHKVAASLLAAGPDMHPVGMNPTVNALQDPIQRNSELNTCSSRSYGRRERDRQIDFETCKERDIVYVSFECSI